MRLISGLPRVGWRHLGVPLAIWLVLCSLGTWGVTWAERRGEREMQQRFDMRVSIAAGFVTDYVEDLIVRERRQGEQFLADETVDAPSFARSVATFGYPAGVLVDSRGRLVQIVPAQPSMIGQEVASRYAHLQTALEQGRPGVSDVVPALATGQPVVAFAVPFDTPHGRRVFSGAVTVKDSPIGDYLGHAIAHSEAQVHLIDADGTVIAGNQRQPDWRNVLADRDFALAAALGRGDSGHFGSVEAPRYFASYRVPGTSWRLVGAVPAADLYGPIVRANALSQTIAVGLAGLGLLAVGLAGRAGHNRARMRASEAEFRGLFDNSLLGMIVTRVDGEIERANASFAALLGYTCADVPRVGWAHLMHPEDLGKSSVLAAAAVRGEIPGFAGVRRLLHASGAVVPVELTSTLIRDEDGEPVHFSTQVLDISERMQRQEEQRMFREELAARARELETANAGLQTANQRVADLVAMLTHDVRQPIATITGYCELLTEMWEDTDDRGKRRDVDRIAATAASMSGYVEEILTLTQVDADTLFARPAPLSVRDVIDEALSYLPPEERAGVTVEADARLRLLADPRQAHQMMVNLIGNGMKYGEPPIFVHARAVGETVEIEIRDSGEGVPEDFVPHLFDRFARASSGVAPTKKGTGLGLYIVQQLAHANNGSVTYHPAEPTGACFVLSLPIATADAGVTIAV